MENYELAIVGMAARFPGAGTVAEFWNNLRNGVESIRQFSDGELLDKGVSPESLRAGNFVKAGAVLDDVDLFDASFFGFSPREAELMDPQHRLFLECAWEAMEHAGYNPHHFPGLVGMYAGTSLSSYLLFNLLENHGIRDAQDTFPTMVGNDKDFLCTRVSYNLNLRGPSLDIQTGCSTSLVALHMACEGLLSCQCDLALAGGISINMPQRTGYFYHSGGVTSPDGHCRAFDEEAQGTVFGSGVGIVVLKRLADSLADGDTIYAVVKGSAINNDGSSKVGYTAPSVDGQAEVIARAQAVAGVRADSIGYVEAHGTATPLGDPVEVQALTKAFQATTDKKSFCAIGSVKTNIGHLDAAAGIAGIIKAVLALHHREIPPMALFNRPNSRIDFANTPFYINRTLTDWRTSSGPRRAGVSSFGIGGTNAHMILEEAPTPQQPQADLSPQILIFSGRSTTAVESMMRKVADYLCQFPDQNLVDVAYTLQVGRKAFKHRRAVVCSDRDQAVKTLRLLSPEHILVGSPSLENRSVAFLFPGQGSQYVRMSQDLYENERLFREHVDRCCAAISSDLKFDLRTVLYPTHGDETRAAEILNQTSVAQPALFVISWSMAQLWIGWGIRPEVMMGHSIGEYVAACVAGVFSLEDALKLVVLRGKLMQQLPAGGMLATALSETDALSLVTDDSLSLAACNGPRQSVLSGTLDAIAQLEASLKNRGVACQRLATSHAFHSAMLEPMMEPFAEEVGKVGLHPPSLPIISNVTGQWMTSSEATEPSYWAQHLRRTVRFSQGVDLLVREPGWALLEVGPGQTLGNLVRRHPGWQTEQMVYATLGHGRLEQSDASHIRATLARLWLAGVNVEWLALHNKSRRHRVALPTYPFERQRYWVSPRTHTNPQAASKREIADWFYTPVWKRTFARKRSPGGPQNPALRWLVFEDGSELSAGILRGLECLGHRPFRVRRGESFRTLGVGAYEIDPTAPDSYVKLLDALRVAGVSPDCVLHLWNANSPGCMQPAEVRFAEAQTNGLYTLLHLARAVAPHRSSYLQIWTVTSQLHDVTGDELLSPENATLLAMCDVLPQEFPHVKCHFIDIGPISGLQRDQPYVEQIVAEITRPDPEARTAFRNGQQWVPWFAPARIEAVPESTSLRARGVYLIVGGLGVIGLSQAEYLAETAAARLILVSRTSFPAKSEWNDWLKLHDGQEKTSQTIRRLQAIEARGGEVLIACADVSSKPQMQAVVKHVQQTFGTLHGVIHAAGHSGETTFRLIEETDRIDCERHFQTKAHGLYVLEEVLASENLDFRILFSSNASVLGGPGLLAYSAAHRFMDAFASSRSRSGSKPWTSINWDHWLVDSSELNQRRGSAAIAKVALLAKEGRQALKIILDHGVSGQIVVSSFDLNVRLDEWIRGQRGNSLGEALPHILHPRPVLDSTYVPPQSTLEKTIIGVWQEFLGVEQIGVHDNFFDLGGNSLIGAKVMGKLNEVLQTNLPMVKLFERPTVSALVNLVSAQKEQQPSYEKRHSRGERRRERLASREQVENA